MNEIYILIGVTGFIYIFTKSKFNKYKKSYIMNKKI